MTKIGHENVARKETKGKQPGSFKHDFDWAKDKHKMSLKNATTSLNTNSKPSKFFFPPKHPFVMGD